MNAIIKCLGGYSNLFAPVTQLAECRPFKAEVGGSLPLGRTIYIKEEAMENIAIIILGLFSILIASIAIIAVISLQLQLGRIDKYKKFLEDFMAALKDNDVLESNFDIKYNVNGYDWASRKGKNEWYSILKR